MNDTLVSGRFPDKLDKHGGPEPTVGETIFDGTEIKYVTIIPETYIGRVPSYQHALFPPGGGGGDMEGRVIRLESDVEHIKNDISDIKTDVREIRSGVSTIHTSIERSKNSMIKFYIFTSLALVGVIFGIMAYFKPS